MLTNYVSPSQNIQSAIADAINSIFQIEIEPRQIAINICYPKYATHYTSAIALAISKQLRLEPLQIATAIAQYILQNHELASQYQLTAYGKGWLNILLREECILSNLRALEEWQLKGITFCEGFWQRYNPLKASDSNDLEAVPQYAYARCCALLRLGYRENLIAHQSLTEANLTLFSLSKWMESPDMRLFFQHLEIAEFLNSEALDPTNTHAKVTESIAMRSKLTRSLAVTFLQFYDRCRIFGVSRELTFSRLCLISITQKLFLAIAPPHMNYAMYL